MDPILYWNAQAIEADRVTHTDRNPLDAGATGPVLSSRSLAIVHLSMHDAYFGIVGGTSCYLHSYPEPPRAGSDGGHDAGHHSKAMAASAVASAAHTALASLYPSQKKSFAAARQLWSLSNGEHCAGAAWGAEVARQILATRAGDPKVDEGSHVAVPSPGRHNVDPSNPGQGFYAPRYGSESRLFATTERLGIDPPPSLTSAQSISALREVRAKGVAPGLQGTVPHSVGELRTSAETEVGIFWAYDGAPGLGTPPRFFNQITRRIAQEKCNDIAQNAQLFAQVNVALADAGILGWAEKYRYDLWRPVVALRQWGSVDGGDAADADVNWLPFGSPRSNGGGKSFTPNFPSYPSGHATFSSAALQTIRLFYGQGDDGPDTLGSSYAWRSEELNGVTTDGDGVVRPPVTRRFPGGLWDMIEEVGRSRVYLGVHWVYDAFSVDEDGRTDLSRNVGGVPLGLAIARNIAENGLNVDRAAGPAPAYQHGCSHLHGDDGCDNHS